MDDADTIVPRLDYVYEPLNFCCVLDRRFRGVDDRIRNGRWVVVDPVRLTVCRSWSNILRADNSTQ